MPLPPQNTLCSYRYDPVNQLITSTPRHAPEEQRFYRKKRLASEIHGLTTYSIFQHCERLLAQSLNKDDTLIVMLLSSDQQRSITQALTALAAPKAVNYSPYGNHDVVCELPSLLAFNGERPLSVTGHYMLGNGYRTFNSALMRFTSPDSLSPFGRGGLNAYVYCSGDPINFSDASGHAPSFTALLKSLFKTVPDTQSREHHARWENRPFPIKNRRLSLPELQASPSLKTSFLGYHGTSIEGATGLIKSGVLPSHSKVKERPGFFLTPDKRVADEYAETAHWNNAREELTKFGKDHIVEVHMRNFEARIPGRDYDFNHYLFDHKNLGHMNMEFIIQPHQFKNLIIRQYGTSRRADMKRPRAHEAPF